MTVTCATKVLFVVGSIKAVALAPLDVARLQRFFSANPEYFVSVNGIPPGPLEAQQEFDDLPPAGMAYSDRWLIGFVDTTNELIAIATVLSDFLAPAVGHIGLFIVATQLHGNGVGSLLHRGLEDWMRGLGMRWIRLGVVAGNMKTERFWRRLGYTEIRQRTGVVSGVRTNMVRVMVKSAADGSLSDYLSLVPRDHPESPLA